MSLLGMIEDDRGATRDQVAAQYACVMAGPFANDADWPRIDRAIKDRWSMSALVYIKRKAWKLGQPCSPEPQPPEVTS